MYQGNRLETRITENHQAKLCYVIDTILQEINTTIRGHVEIKELLPSFTMARICFVDDGYHCLEGHCILTMEMLTMSGRDKATVESILTGSHRYILDGQQLQDRNRIRTEIMNKRPQN